MPGLSRPLTAANALGALLSAGFGLAGLLDPGLALPDDSAITGGVHLYAAAYAARALPLGAALLHQLLAGRGGRGLPPLLALAGAVQIADAAIGLATRNPGMTLGATALAALHLGSAARLARSARPARPARPARSSAPTGA
ncbi:hypothetical protein [Kitasatospora sp. NPDC056184]|uniref:hypothetical protein n=1 Tax=Kitasatospora sp. NPDC056184 TaxID=3345738 RepID=UPI0035DD24B5